MGYMRHHAILVTSWNEDVVADAHLHALHLGLTASSITASPMNGYRTFVVVPDGSKEGWPDSEMGDAKRERFVAWLNTQRYEDGSTSFDWAVVQYGDENGDNRVIAHDAELRWRRSAVS